MNAQLKITAKDDAQAVLNILEVTCLATSKEQIKRTWAHNKSQPLHGAFVCIAFYTKCDQVHTIKRNEQAHTLKSNG